VRTLSSTYIKTRSNFIIKAFNKDVPYEDIKKEIESFGPDIMQIFGPLYLGNASRFVDDFYGKCKIVQHYAGGVSAAYWNPKVDALIIDKVHEPVFGHVPKDRLVTRNNCCDLDFFRPLNTPKKYDCIMAAGFYALKGQNIVIDILKDEKLSVLFIGSQKSNMGDYTEEYLQTKKFYTDISPILTAEFIDFVPPSEMPSFYNSAKIFVWGSLTSIENPITITNRSITEAVACGLPVVAFKGTFGASNFVIHGRNAILVSSYQEYKEAVLELLKNDALRNKMSAESRVIAETILDFKIWHDELHFNLYKRLLGA
jgi:glycosyltransferase involved in cell wall biosynthesis